MKGITALVMAIIGLNTSLSAHAIDLNKDITVTGKTSVAVNVTAPEYFRGIISSDEPLESLVITDPEGKLDKTLINSGEKEAEVFWLVAKSGDYHFQITPQSSHTATVSIQLHTLALKKSQFVSPKQALISPLLRETAKKLQQHLPLAEAHFWNIIEEKGTPLIEKSKTKGHALLTFLYKGKPETKNVRVLGAPYDGHVHLSRLPDSNIWFKTYNIPQTSRFSYRIAPNVPQLAETNWKEQRRAVLATTQPDPLSHSALFSQNDELFGAASTITLAKAPSDNATQAMNNPQGNVSDYSFTSQMLKNTRKISIYQPNNIYSISNNAPLLILFDGDAYLSKVPTPTILDNLIAAGKVPPMRAVFINTPVPSMREKELTPNQTFADFMANELIPWLCQQHNVCPAAKNTILSGSSYGGLSSMYIAFRHPEKFGKVLSQSGSFWWAPGVPKGPATQPHHWLADQISTAEKKPIDIYMNAGVFETKPVFSNILETNRYLYKILENKGYQVDFVEVASGHDYFSWRVMLADGLIKLFDHDTKPNQP